MKNILLEMKNISFYDSIITIKSAMNEENKEEIEKLAKAIKNSSF